MTKVTNSLYNKLPTSKY